jgi:hypothetical protein
VLILSILYKNFLFLKSQKTAGSSIEYGIIKELIKLNEGFSYSTAHEIQQINLELNHKDLFIDSFSKRRKLTINNRYLRGVFNRFFKYGLISGGFLTEHMDANSLKELLNTTEWTNKYKVTSIRNPWDIMTSYYRWNITGRNGMGSPLKGKDISFEDFLDIVIFRKGKKEIVKRMRPAKKLLYPYVYIDGELACDYYIRFESLNEDFNYIAKNKLDLKNVSLPHHKSTKKKVNTDKMTYRDYYINKTKKIVSEYFNKYINDFNYKF